MNEAEFDKIPGVPTREQLKADVKDIDALAFNSVYVKLSNHLGSLAAARVWLYADMPEQWGGRPIDLIKSGGIDLIEDHLNDITGPSPSY